MKDVPTERWKRIDAILDGALDLPTGERVAFLDKECGDDHDLRSKVEAMLGAGQVASGFLENQGPEGLAEMKKAVRDAAERAEDTLAGTHVGPYRLIRAIGRGGMGQVYLAMRDDQSYTRYVAVKVIRRGMDTEEIQHRFRMERRILASLAHPNIARLLDGGATEEGLSYFVMEYVDGEPILEYCDSRNMPVKDRLKLFRQVCSAVQFAHQNLIVHRDLKPGNILVTADGTPKLLDFGIAKVLNPNLTGYTVPMTAADARVMTPEYASPEQMRGGTVTTASDVYQLGILLYEMLTGARPHRTEGRTRREIEDLILKAEPERPSTAITQVSRDVLSRRTQGPDRNPVDVLRRTLSGDLDRIVLMALRKEPDRRYPSVDLLQEDIKRYLEGLPVSAQADTFIYRASKFVRRHKAGVVATAALAILLVAITVLAIRFALVTSEQADRIALAAQKNEEVSRFLASTFQAANPVNSRGRDVTVVELMEDALTRVDRELVDQPALQAHMLLEMGIAYREIGDFETSGTLLERSLAMRRADPETLPHDMATSLYELGMHNLEVGDLDEAEELMASGIELQRSIGGQDDLVAAGWANDLASVSAYSGKPEETRQILENSLRIQTAAYDDRHPDVMVTRANLAWIYHETGELEQAEAIYRTLVDNHRDTVGSDHPDAITNLANLGAVLNDTGRFSEAETVHRQAYALRLRVLGEDHPQVANSLSHIGRALRGQGRLDEAEQLFRDVAQLHLDQLGDEHRHYGRDLYTLASLLLEKQELTEAEQQAVRSLEVYGIAFEEVPDHPWIQESRDLLKEIYTVQGQPEKPVLY